MSDVSTLTKLCIRDYDAVLFDLDGVLTRTAAVHSAAWKRLFDDFLEQYAVTTGVSLEPFDRDLDYRLYVDGRPRYDGVAAFLDARGIDLPWGNPEDDAATHSIVGLGRLKDKYFKERLAQEGAEVFESAIGLVRELRLQQIRTAVVSASKNCEAVLDAAGITDLFDARVDGNDIDKLSLKGKPAADSFLEAARQLGVEADRAVVVEDAIAGVEAGRSGRFGLVIGVGADDERQALLDAGADVVVADLAQVKVISEPAASWTLVYDHFAPDQEGVREALCTQGNGYFATRAAALGSVADGVHYPGTYLACGYNRLRTDVAGRAVENEDLVNLTNWLSLQFRIGTQDWFDVCSARLLSYRQELDLRRGMLLRDIRFQDSAGNVTALHEERLVSMSDMHIAAVKLVVTSENWKGPLTVRSALDGRIVNAGASLYRKFNKLHLQTVSSEEIDGQSIALTVRTSQSRIEVAQAARTTVSREGKALDLRRLAVTEPGYIAHEMALDVQAGQSITFEKIVSFHTSKDPAISESGVAARKTLSRAGEFNTLKASHVRSWLSLWRRFDVHLVPAGSQSASYVLMLLRLNMFHLLQTVSPHSIGLDIGVPARGWTGEAYQGHIFWDEVFIFPFFNLRMPEITRSLLMYRFRRLDEARTAARLAGFKGAMFPWQSGSDGQEETQDLNLNPRSQRWVPDNSYRQRHVGSAIAYNVWQYFQVSNDIEFMQAYGAELILDIAKFWSSAAHYSPERGRYEIHGVMGPDEFHEGYPNSAITGIDNNAYTNVMAVWVFHRALDALNLLPGMDRSELMNRLDLTAREIERWKDISHRMYVPFHSDGIISQFEGYEGLPELDWEAYRERYGNIQRLDLILEAEDDSANNYRVSKQPDVLMLFYLFSSEELASLFAGLDYPWDEHTIPDNVAFYNPRSSHGSTLSRVVHAWVLARSDRESSMRFFSEALQSDLLDIQQGTTAEGVHLGAMAGSVDLVERVSTGIEMSGDMLRLNPGLPPELARLEMRIHYRGHSLDLRLTRETLTVRGRNKGPKPILLSVQNKQCEFFGGTTRVFPLQ